MKLKRIVIAVLFVLAANITVQAAWFDTNFNYKRRIVIQSSQVDADVSDFPVLLTEANLDANFFSHVQKSTVADMDIIFTNAAEDTELDREVVVFSTGPNQLEVWVKVPNVSSTVNTDIYVYYGYAGANKPNSTATWSNGFAGVWHMNEASGTFQDSSPNNNTGTTPGFTNNLPDRLLGVIHGAQDFDGNYDLINMGEPASLDINGNNSLTLQAWVWFDALLGSEYHDYLTKGDNQYHLQKDGGVGDNRVQFAIYDTDWCLVQSNNNMNINTWYHTVGRYDRTAANEVSLFVNGVKQTAVNTADFINDTSQDVVFGRNEDFTSSRHLDGRMDEVRICDVPRPDGWISTEYKNQRAPAVFYQVDTEQVQATPTVTPTATPTSTITLTSTHTPTLTTTLTLTVTNTSTPTPSPTITLTSTISPTSTITQTRTISPTSTISATRTHSTTITVTPTVTITPTNTITPTPNLAALDLSNVVLYPNPYRSDLNTRNQVVFFNLPAVAKIRIYNLEGKLVAFIDKDDPGNRAVWDLTNRAGKRVASGVYVYVIKTNREKKSGKILLAW